MKRQRAAILGLEALIALALVFAIMFTLRTFALAQPNVGGNYADHA